MTRLVTAFTKQLADCGETFVEGWQIGGLPRLMVILSGGLLAFFVVAIGVLPHLG
jgi:hypothetical protein